MNNDLDFKQFKFQTNCRICKNNDLKKVISFGKSPLANSLLAEDELEKEELFPLELMYCGNCHLCQLSYVVPPEKMFKNYLFLTSTTETTRKHFEKMAETVKKNLNLKENYLIVDIGSNDGTLLKYFKNIGMKTIGIEPAKNISKIANDLGIPTMNTFWDKKTVEEIIKNNGKAEVIVATNVFAHVKDIWGFTENVKSLLKDDGAFIIEAQYLLDTIKGLTFDNIYHEHVSYYSLLSLNEFFKKNEMEIFKVEHFEVHGGSIRIFVQKKGGKYFKDESVDKFLKEEINYRLDKFSTYEKFFQDINEKKEKIRNLIIKLKNEGKKIVGYGAPAKATTSLNFYHLDKEHIDYIVEDNPLKKGKIVPGVRIPIKDNDYLAQNIPDYIYILAWNYTDEIIKNHIHLKNQGVRFIVPYPELKII